VLQESRLAYIGLRDIDPEEGQASLPRWPPPQSLTLISADLV
jgi:hypothetical protein